MKKQTGRWKTKTDCHKNSEHIASKLKKNHHREYLFGLLIHTAPRAGRMAQCLRTLAALVEHACQAPDSHTVAHNRLQLQFQTGALYWPLRAPHCDVHTYRKNTHMLKTKTSEIR